MKDNDNNPKKYITVCIDFLNKEKEYYKIINEFYEVYLKNVQWSIMKEYISPVDLKEEIETKDIMTVSYTTETGAERINGEVVKTTTVSVSVSKLL